MIDGIDLQVDGLEPSLWLNNHVLSGRFSTKVNPRTGRAIDGIKRATYQGLTFEIVPARDGKARFTVRGSLHKYGNAGIHNADQFAFSDLLRVIDELKNLYAVIPESARIEGIEFGVNMELPIEVKRVLNSAIAYKDKTFEVINPRRPSIGRLCTTHDYDVKLYDKVLQAGSDFPLPVGLPGKNLLRYEIKVNKMRWLAGYGIKTLSDLTQAEKVFSLSRALSNILEKVVFVDIHADLSALNSKEQARFGMARDRDKWRKFNKSQRYEIKE
jgi:hypothetical protein